jgi:hypothetical protein
MKNMIIGLYVLLLNTAISDEYEEGKVTRIIVEQNFASIWLSGSDNNNECEQAAGRWTVTNDDPLFKEKYATILAAATSGKVIKLRHLTSNACGVWGSNKIYFVEVNYLN